MSRFDPARMIEIVGEAMELPAARRASFLDSTCGGDLELRREVEDLLECADPAVQAFDAASDHMICDDPQQIGPYTILEQIGEGGMAVVYRAQQHSPVKRIVALKLIKLGMDTRQFVARFEAERQALAVMDHPNVARVYDAGSTEAGRPYFVMEFVAGRPILEYCDEHHLGVRQRLELFITVCEAVEHAHRKGIIHRDIKNSNVLIADVDGKAVPKVIDFGIAKAIQQPLTERTLQTELGQLIGTPEYMSPEQAERGMLDIDTRADVYSLGVLLYELIAGVQPIPSEALRGVGYEQVQRVIRESEPQRPSTRLSTLAGVDATRIAQRRSTALPTLIRNLRSELEWIPLKAMRKDREQRYRGAAELADDIRNYLDGRPLIAGPESTTYKLRKFLRRHKTGVAAATTMILLLIGGIITTSWQAIRASQERDNAQAVLDFLTDDVLAGATPERIPDAKVREQIVNAMITPAANRVGEQFRDRPIIEANIRETIRSVLVKIGRRDLALPHAEAALAIRRRELGEDHIDTLTSLNNLASVLEKLGRYKEAEPLYKQSMDRRRKLLGDEHPKTLMAMNNYGHVLWIQDRWAEAEPLYKQVLEARRRVLGEDAIDTVMSLNNYASVIESQNHFAEAEPLYKQALDKYRRILGDDDTRTMMALNNYANVLGNLKRDAEAEPLFQQLVERGRRVLGDEHPNTLFWMSNQAICLKDLGRLPEAEMLCRSVSETCRRTIGPDHPDTLRVIVLHVAVLHLLGRYEETLVTCQDVLERSTDDQKHGIFALHQYAVALKEVGKPGEAETYARRAVTRAKADASLGPIHEDTRNMASHHANCLDALGRRGEAAAVRQEFGLPAPTTQPAAGPATNPA